MPEWLLKSLFVFVFVTIVLAFAWRNTQREIALLRERRPSPTKSEFLALLEDDIHPETAEFIWTRAEDALGSLTKGLLPHPDDNFTKDLPIDDEEWSLDWPREFAEMLGKGEVDLPAWPVGWAVTIRNYARWLDLAR